MTTKKEIVEALILTGSCMDTASDSCNVCPHSEICQQTTFAETNGFIKESIKYYKKRFGSTALFTLLLQKETKA